MSRIDVDGKEIEVSGQEKTDFELAQREYRKATDLVRSIGALNEYKERMKRQIDAYLLNINEQRRGGSAEIMARIEADLKELSGSFQ